MTTKKTTKKVAKKTTKKVAKKKEVVQVKLGDMTIVPPKPENCNVCGVWHVRVMPHDATSLYYLTKFKVDHGRDATWEDALEHCPENIKTLWRLELEKFGVDSKSTNVGGIKK